MNILVSVNDSFIYPLKVLLFSLYKTQKDKVNIYLLNIRLSNNNLTEISKFCRELGLGFESVSLRKGYLDVLMEKDDSLKKESLSIETYARLFAPSLIDIPRALWLDADCLVRRDLFNFYYQDLDERYIAACDLRNWRNQKISSLGFENYLRGEYFNAGVILFDIKKCSEILKEDAVIDMIRNYSGEHFDQGILNKFFTRDKVKWCDPLNYNMFMNQDWSHGFLNNPIQYELYEKASILHYLCPYKPWRDRDMLEFDKGKYWWECEKEMNSFLEKT